MVVEVEEEGLVLATFLLLASVDDGACGSDGLGEVALLVHVLNFVEGADGLPADEQDGNVVRLGETEEQRFEDILVGWGSKETG